MTGIGGFLAPFLVALMMFSFPMLIINPANSDDPDDANTAGYILRIAFSDPLNAILDQYQQTLDAGDVSAEHNGDYSRDMAPEIRLLSVFVFVGSTGFLQVTLLNMLIAIMSDIFD